MDSTQGFFFDLDGTLISNIDVMVKSYHSFMESFNQKGTREEFERYNGIPIKKFLSDFVEKNKINISVSDLWQKYEDLLLENYSQTTPRDGVVEVFNLLKKKNIPYAIVTSASRNLVTSWCDNQLDEKIIPPSITSDDVEKTKPDPEPYLKAMRLIGCSQGYAVEDSYNGVVSASGAGLKTFLFQDSSHVVEVDNIYGKITNYTQLEKFIESL